MSLSELKRLLRRWDHMVTRRRGLDTASRANNVYHHFDRHGTESDIASYLRNADAFPRGHGKGKAAHRWDDAL